MDPRTEPPPPVPAWLPPSRPRPEQDVFYPYDELAYDQRPDHEGYESYESYDEPDATRHDLLREDPADDVHQTAVLPDGEAPPVFVDVSGRRARLAKRLGILVGSALTAYLVVIGVNLAMDADVPLTPWPAGTGETGSPAPGDRPGTREPSPDSADRRAGSGSGPSPTAGAKNAETTPEPAPSAVRTSQRGKAPVTPPGQTRDKPKPNG